MTQAVAAPGDRSGPPPGMAAAQPAANPGGAITGVWLVEDQSGAIEFYPCGRKVCGRLVWFSITPGLEGSPAVDLHNPDPKKRNRPMCGLVLVRSLKPRGPDQWGDGTIYDPDSGSIYDAEVSLADPDALEFRGYIGLSILGQSQRWTRASPDLELCRKFLLP